MKLAVENETPVISGEITQGEFHIKSSAKAFQILSSGLYSDKILAIVRELSCNAYDSHIEAGKADEPFTVQFPNALNPEFRIRDYGVGLDDEGVTQVYTTYFESTKQDSNAYVGALGLGSKSPFSYTKNFSIVAYKDGVKRAYSAFVDGSGIPNFVLLDSSETDEENGVEVKFAVDKNDFYKFKEAGEKVYKWFGDAQPEIKGNRFTVRPVPMRHVQIIPGVDIRESNYGGPYARQGVVVYPLRPNEEDIDEDLRDLLEVSFVIDFPIGSLDVAASREELSYIDHTNDNINARLREIQEGLLAYVKAEVNKAKSDWEKVLIMDKMRDDTFQPILKSIMAQQSKLFDTIKVDDGTYGTPNIVVNQSKAWDFSEYTTKTRNHSTGEVRLSRESWSPVLSDPDKDGNRDVVGHTLKVFVPKATVFLNDTGKRNVLGRVRQYCRDNAHGKKVYVVVAEGKKALKAAMAALGQPPIIKCSGLDEPPKYSTKATSTTKISLLKLSKRARGSSRSYYTQNDNWQWDQQTISLADASKDDKGKTQTTLYVPLKNRTVLGPTEMDKSSFYGFMDTCVKAGLIDEAVVVYGVRKSVIKELTSDYVNLFDDIKKKVAAVSVQRIAANVKRISLAKSSMFSEPQLAHLKDELGDKHAVATIADEAIGADKISGAESPTTAIYVSNVARDLGMKLDVSGIKDKAHKEGVDLWNEFVADYPLLQFTHMDSQRVRSRALHASIEYIKLVDDAA